jgi:excisionase family DNA binding protein
MASSRNSKGFERESGDGHRRRSQPLGRRYPSTGAETVQLALRSHPLTREDVLTAREVAEFVKLPRSTVYDLARRGLIPGHRIGRAWRFVRQEIEEWLFAS